MLGNPNHMIAAERRKDLLEEAERRRRTRPAGDAPRGGWRERLRSRRGR